MEREKKPKTYWPYFGLYDNQLISIIMTKKEVVCPFRNGLQVASVVFLKWNVLCKKHICKLLRSNKYTDKSVVKNLLFVPTPEGVL